MAQRANYRVIADNTELLLIEDIGPHDQYLTITNGAEQVVKELAPRLNGRRLEYIDSNGDRDQLLVKNGEFAGFAPAPLRRN